MIVARAWGLSPAAIRELTKHEFDLMVDQLTSEMGGGT